MPDELEIDRGALIFASLAEVYIDSGMYDEAIAILKDGLLRNPTYNFGHFLLGKAYYLKNDFKSAEEKFIQTITNDPKMVSGYVYLGHVQRKLENLDRALEYYNRALELNPKDNEVRNLVKEVESEMKPAVDIKSETVEEAKVAGPELISTPTQPTEEELKPEEVISAEIERIVDTSQLLKISESEPEAPTLPESPVLQEIPVKAKLDKIMTSLINLESVRGALVITPDGLIIGNYLRPDLNADEYAASIAAIYNEATSCFNFLEQGVFERGVIERKEETIYIFASQEAILSVITLATTKPGLVFTFCGKILNELKEILE
ncbi:MAG: tetratricopeptide repeat protein [candidate division WOR-3 bacterium]